MSKSTLRVIHEKDFDSYKKWLLDNAPINVRQGLGNIISNNNPCSLLQQMEISHLESKLIGNIRFAGSLITAADGIMTLDNVVAIEANYNDPYILSYYIRSRSKELSKNNL